MTDAQPPDERNRVEELAEDFLARHRRGEQPDISEYTARHPELAEDIRELFPALLLLEDARPHSEDSGTRPHLSGRDGPLDRLGDYRILREVGRGGMGIVYEAEQLSLGRHVALKVLPAHALLDPRHLQRFHREARAAARLHHTNIVPVFGVGECDGLHYYVMQFIPGLGLDKVLDDLKHLREAGRDQRSPNQESSTLKLPGQEASSTVTDSGSTYWRGVARIGVQVAEALDHAASQGVLHRDIKPSNLLLDAHGTVWVTDFGLAKTLDEDELTQTGDIVGTLRYMAPERLKGTSDVRSDLYGLGLTLYELLALRPAFPEKDRHELLRQVVEQEPPRLDRLDPKIPRDLVTIVEKASAKRPADRYFTARAMADDLRRYLDDRPINARRTGQVERAWRWCKRNRAVASLIFLVALLAVGASGLALLEQNTRRAASRAERQRSAAEIVEAEKTRLADETRLVADFLVREVIFPGATPHGHAELPPTLAALERAEGRIPEIFKGQPLGEATLRHRLGKSYFRIDRPSDARQHLEIAYELRKKHNGQEHRETLESMEFLSLALREEGKISEARALREELLAILGRTRGASSPEATTCSEDLVALLRDEGDLGKARALCEELLLDQRKRLGPEHARTLETLLHLVLVLRAQGELPRALELCEEVIAARTRILGPEDRKTLAARALKTVLLKDRGQLGEALDHGKLTLATQSRILGESDGDTLSSACTISLVLWLLGRTGESHALCEATLDTGHCFLVSVHPDARDPKLFASTLECIDSFEKEGKLEKAATLSRELLSLQVRSTGWGSAATQGLLDRTLGLLRKLGRSSEIAGIERGIRLAKGLESGTR